MTKKNSCDFGRQVVWTLGFSLARFVQRGLEAFGYTPNVDTSYNIKSVGGWLTRIRRRRTSRLRGLIGNDGAFVWQPVPGNCSFHRGSPGSMSGSTKK